MRSVDNALPSAGYSLRNVSDAPLCLATSPSNDVPARETPSAARALLICAFCLLFCGCGLTKESQRPDRKVLVNGKPWREAVNESQFNRPPINRLNQASQNTVPTQNAGPLQTPTLPALHPQVSNRPPQDFNQIARTSHLRSRRLPETTPRTIPQNAEGFSGSQLGSALIHQALPSVSSVKLKGVVQSATGGNIAMLEVNDSPSIVRVGDKINIKDAAEGDSFLVLEIINDRLLLRESQGSHYLVKL